MTIRTILFPTDFSRGSDFAFPVACALARDYDARLVLLHVVAPPPSEYGGGIVAPATERDWEEQREKLRGVRPADHAIKVEHILLEGYPAAQILRCAGETKADMIVMGTHGRAGLHRLLMGSVAEHVVRNGCCPVLTVKVPSSEDSGSPPRP